MEQFIYMVGITALLIANSLIACGLAWLLTEVVHLPWKVKPFNCRGCLSFWLSFVVGSVLAYFVTHKLETRFCLVVIAFLTGIINYQYIKIKFRVYE